jgi:hypothetical protein
MLNTILSVGELLDWDKSGIVDEMSDSASLEIGGWMFLDLSANSTRTKT